MTQRRSTLVLADSAITAVPDPAFATDLSNGRIIAWNLAASRLTGVTRGAAMTMTCGTLFDGVDEAGAPVCSVDCRYRRLSRGYTTVAGETDPAAHMPGACTTWERHPDMLVHTATGPRRVTVASLPALIDGQPSMLHILRPCPSADTDPLTHAMTREAFALRVAEEQRRAQRSGGSLALAVVDVDRLKDMNDGHGHAAGDRALVVIAEALRLGRAGDAVARWGGDEFCVLLLDTAVEQARRRLERTLKEVRAARLTRDGGASFSAGVTRLGAEEPLAAAFDRADAALYRAKQAGRARVVAAPA